MCGTLPVTCDARMQRFAEYLAAKAPPGRLPGRQHIEPTEIPGLLPYLTLLDVVPQPNGDLRYRIRLAGTHIVDLLGIDGTGKFVDEILTTDCGSDVIRGYRDMVSTRQPQYLDGSLRGKGREHITFQRIGFPLARNGEDVDMLVLMMVGFDPRKQKFVGEHHERR